MRLNYTRLPLIAIFRLNIISYSNSVGSKTAISGKRVYLELLTYSLLWALISRNMLAFELETSGGERKPIRFSSDFHSNEIVAKKQSLLRGRYSDLKKALEGRRYFDMKTYMILHVF